MALGEGNLSLACSLDFLDDVIIDLNKAKTNVANLDFQKAFGSRNHSFQEAETHFSSIMNIHDSVMYCAHS